MFAELREEMSAEHKADVEAQVVENDGSTDEHDPDKVEISQYYKHSGGSNSGADDDLIDIGRRS